MSDRYAGRISIGGTLPAKRLNELARVIFNTDPGIMMQGSYPTARALLNWLSKREKPEPLFLSAGELVNGSFQALEQWLRANKMSFLRHSDSYCDVEAEIVGYVNGANVRSDANNAGDAMVRASDVWRAKDMLFRGKMLDAMALLNSLLPNVYDVPPFMVEYAHGRLR